jgi:hypothetical protein
MVYAVRLTGSGRHTSVAGRTSAADTLESIFTGATLATNSVLTRRGTLTSALELGAVLVSGLAHEGAALDTRDVSGLEFMGFIVRLDKHELHILALNQELVLRIRDIDGRVMDEHILTSELTLAGGDEPISCLVIEPLN